MSKLPPPPLLLLFLLTVANTVITIETATATDGQSFKEAPKFYNSPTCVHLPSHDMYWQQAVHVAMTLDDRYLRGSMAAIHSILQHSSCPENIRFHFISSPSSPATLHATVTSSFPYLRSQVYTFDTTPVSGLISTSIRSALDNPLNYARNYLANILPQSLHRVIYLDSDLVLVDDIAELEATPIGDNAVLAAPEYWVMVIDLERWRINDYTTKIVEWMELQKRIRIYELGSLPPFLLVFAGNIAPVDRRWNQHGLGGDNFGGLCRDLHPGPVSLLHWSGKGKPWVRLDANRPCPLDVLWAPYDLLRSPSAID
ncbi:hypothetical protein K2173_021446 [Erythroxylum novogranatense]|uniref:Hexosyltransferase n=1 Tax=Erythroxylum novogranatense TaxID=1862640 RepID=A0AAV8TXP1_9ROSI|nr:hypothetical protein K2173_021446 [Erythroxylum novogranatense]